MESIQAIYEKLGLFYLGKDVDKQTQAPTEILTLLKNKNFTTHAAIIGMTGSGKTGLGIGLIEEALIDNIPAIVIDPKGDMGNLCLTDPTFSPEHFEPWVADEAKTKESDPKAYAQKIATVWREGIESWGQDHARVERFHTVPKTIYTPGSSAGIPVNILSSLEMPSPEVMEESDLFASYLKSTVLGLLALVGINADPLESKEYILIAQILSRAWLAQERLGIEAIISRVINPPFEKIGVLPLEDFYPQQARFKLASKFNALLATPHFALWFQGADLDIQKLLYDENGKAKIAIFSIAHLNDDERMFFVTLLLNRYISWMRRQSGTSALKTLLYMDEIYGFFPPTKNPPSKEPMMVMLKQARAFGVGVVLSTQNPVDLDYKGLSNIGTWFIGRLQTTQDIDRVIDGLGGKVGASYDKKEIKSLLANLQKRTFFLKSAHLEDIRLFTTRWVLSYLKGPLKRQEIADLMAPQKAQVTPTSPQSFRGESQGSLTIQQIDDSIVQYFEPDVSGTGYFYPTIGAKVTVHFYQERRGIDLEREEELYLPLEYDTIRYAWEEAEDETLHFDQFPKRPPAEAKLEEVPSLVLDDRGLKLATRELKEEIYRSHALELYRCKSPKLESKVEESRADFIVRVQDLLDDQKEQEIEKLKERYGRKEKRLLERLAKAKERVEKESSDSTSSMIEAGIAVLGALFGHASATKVGRAVSKGSRVLKERGEMSRAQERVEQINEELESLSYELEEKIDALSDRYSIDNCEIDTVKIKPKKRDIDIELMGLVWRVA